MTPSTRRRTLHALAALFAAAPLAFSWIRAAQANDLRMLWMAIAAFLGASAVALLAPARHRETRGVLARALLALSAATLLAGVMGYGLGSTSGVGIWMVAFVLAFCWAASYALDALAYPRGS